MMGSSLLPEGYETYVNQHYTLATNRYPFATLEALSEILWQEWSALDDEERYEYAQVEQYTHTILKKTQEKHANKLSEEHEDKIILDPSCTTTSSILSANSGQVENIPLQTTTFTTHVSISPHAESSKHLEVSTSPSATKTENISPALSRTASLSPRMIDFYEPLKLEHLRTNLVRLEESIIFVFIERAQFKLNADIYDPSAMPQFGGRSCLMHFLKETENMHSIVRRYLSPDEHPFYDRNDLPEPILPPVQYPLSVKPNTININDRILDFYLNTILPSICVEGDDQNYGSCALYDISCLQILSKRIHYGKFVAESKFRSEPQLFTEAIRKKDISKLTELITKPVVEEQILQRVHLKAATYGTEPTQQTMNAPSPRNAGSSSATYKISPDIIASIYQQIMTLTKDVQIEYLLQRLS